MTLNDPMHSVAAQRTARGFTLVEMLLVLMVMAICATIALDAVAEADAGLKADRAAREAYAALLYARTMAVNTGTTYGVEFDTTNKRFQVYQGTGSNVVTQTLSSGGTYVVALSRPELNGTTMTPTITGDTTNPYDVAYSALGTTANPGTVVFTYAGKSKTVTIPKLGDPTMK